MSVQLYAKTTSLTPTEPSKLTYHGYFNDPAEEILLEHDMDCIKAFEKSILEEGIKYCVVIDKEGKILDGNCRYHVAIKNNIQYVPVIILYFVGEGYKIPKVKVKN